MTRRYATSFPFHSNHSDSITEHILHVNEKCIYFISYFAAFFSFWMFKTVQDVGIGCCDSGKCEQNDSIPRNGGAVSVPLHVQDSGHSAASVCGAQGKTSRTAVSHTDRGFSC